MASKLALQAVRKHKAKKSHLTVPAKASADIATLCGVEMRAGDYDLVDEADCQPCLRKQGNEAFISSAYFAQDAGTRLLEMSLAQAKADRGDRPAKPARGVDRSRKRPPASRPDLKVVPDLKPEGADAEKPARQPARSSPQRQVKSSGGPTARELAALGLDDLRPDGPDVYRSDGGVMVRVERRGGTWRVAEVVLAGRTQVRKPASGRVAIEVADVTVRVGADGELTLGPG
ncbi:MAG: hypothetical protein QOE95_1985 [Gaiellaceae bacterium]|nr:hypothetical protein [Gaiellaceae bacterium]